MLNESKTWYQINCHVFISECQGTGSTSCHLDTFKRAVHTGLQENFGKNMKILIEKMRQWELTDSAESDTDLQLLIQITGRKILIMITAENMY